MAMAMKMVAMEVAKQVIQIVGEKLGLPQGIIDMCKMACASAAGMPDSARTSFGQAASRLASQLNLSPSDSGRFQREMQGLADNTARSVFSEFEKMTSSNMPKRATNPTEEDEGGSWLVALAKSMGKMMDKKAGQMQTLSEKISAASDKDTKAGSKEANTLMSDNAKLQAYGQELGILSNAFSQIAKSVGEAQQTAARK